LGQTVPSMGSSNREGPITDGGQPCTTDIHTYLLTTRKLGYRKNDRAIRPI